MAPRVLVPLDFPFNLLNAFARDAAIDLINAVVYAILNPPTCLIVLMPSRHPRHHGTHPRTRSLDVRILARRRIPAASLYCFYCLVQSLYPIFPVNCSRGPQTSP